MTNGFKKKLKDPVHSLLPDRLRLIIQNRAAFAQDAESILRYGIHSPRMWQLMFCCPSEIQYSVALPAEWINQGYETNPVLRRNSKLLRDDDWDKNLIPVDALKNFSSIAQRIKGASWESTAYYQLLVSRVDAGAPVSNYTDIHAIMSRYERLDSLIDYLKKGGLLVPQKNLGLSFRERGGIEVGVSRHGQLVLTHGGRHRLAAAQYLGLDIIPICLTRVHPHAIENGAWKAFRRKSIGHGQTLYRKLAAQDRPMKSTDEAQPGLSADCPGE